MKKLEKIFILLILLLVAFASFNTISYATELSSDAFVGEQTFKLSNDATVHLTVSSAWDAKTDSDGNIVFSNLKATEPMYLTLLYNTFPYTTNEDLKQYIGLHKQQAVKTIPNNGKIQEGYDKIIGLTIPWIMIFEEKGDSKTFHKILYPYNKNFVFTVVISISGPASLPEAEKLLNTIIISILKETSK